MCPKDNIIYSNVDNIDYFKVNKNILEKIKQSQNNQTQNDSTKIDIISLEKEKTKSTKTKIDTITVNDSTLNNNTNTLTSINNQNPQQCYIKKTIKFNKKLKFTNNSLICSIHSLPLNVICVNDRQKICSQCALNNLHLEHQIITENKFMDYVNELIKILQDIEINKNNYVDVSDINSNFILEEIENKIDFYKNDVQKICKEIIENINLQCRQIEKFLNLRKKEIFTKFQFTNYNIDNLRESTNHWLDLVNNKLSEANSGNNNDDINIESLKLLDVDKNKNIFNLIDIGRQLNERYNFVKETKDIIDKLNQFNIKGMTVEKNSEIIDLIMMNPMSIDIGLKERKINSNFNNKYNYNESIINSTNVDCEKTDNNNNKNKNDENKLETSLFIIEEDKNLIESLHLTPISYLYRQTKNIFITYENDNNLEDNEICNSISNIYNLFPTNNNKDNNNNIYLKKKLNTNKMSKTQNNFLEKNNDKITINKRNIINNNNEKNKQKRLALSGGNTRYNTHFYKNNDDNFDKNNEEKNINIQLSPMYRKVLFPKLLKVKTCDVFLIGNEKIRKSMSMDDDEMNKKINKLEYNHGNTLHKLTMSPQIKSKYNLNVNKNLVVNQKEKEKINEKNKSKSKKDLKKKDKTNNERNNNKNEIKARKKYIRCVSCSGLNKKDIQDAPIIFNLNVNNENNFNSSKNTNTNNNKSSVSDFFTNNDIILKKSQKLKNKTKKIKSRHLNKSCICKQENKTNYNFINFNNNYNTNFSTNVSINNINKNNNSTFINKDMNDLQKCVNSQMKKSNPSFNRVNMSGIGMQLLCNYMQKNQKKKYKELKLPGCNLDDGDFSLLIKNIIDNEIELSILNVSYNNLSDNSSRYIFEMIIKNKNSLKSIFMYNNMFSKGFKNKIKNYDKDNNLDSIKLYI